MHGLEMIQPVKFYNETTGCYIQADNSFILSPGSFKHCLKQQPAYELLQ